MSDFDIEKFPISETAKRMLRRVSPIYDRSYVGKWLYEVMGREWDSVWDCIKTMPDQVFTSTVTWGIEYQEDKYSLPHDDTLSLDERRARLCRKRNDAAPVSPWAIESYIKNAWDMDVDIDETHANGVIGVNILQDDRNQLRKMLQDLKAIKPSHLSLLVCYKILGELIDYLQIEENAEFSLHIDALPTIDRYPWRGRYFDGSWNFQALRTFDGRFLFDGKNIFNSAQSYAETGKTVGHFFNSANAFDGSWKFGNTQDGVAYFNSEEPDAPLIITPKLALSDNYEIPYTFDGTLAMDGGWTFGRNPMRDVLSITTHHVPKLTMQDIYPLARMQFFDGSWSFGTDLRMFDGSWNFNTGLFNGLAETPGVECRSRLFDGSWQFDGKAPFVQPERTGVLFNASEDYQENLVIEETTESLDDTAEMQEGDALTSRLTFADHLNERKLFDGSWNFAASQSFSGQNFDGSFRFDSKKHFDSGSKVFDGSWQFNAGANDFAGEEIQEELSAAKIHAELEDTETMEEEMPLLIDTGLFFNGSWKFDGDTKIRLDGSWQFDGRYTFTNYPSLDTVFSGARKFDGSWNIKRGGHSFEHSYARTA